MVYTGLFFLLYLTIVANNTVVIDKLITMERGSEFVGLKWSIQSFCEIPAYLLLNRMIAKWKNERLILIAGIFLTLQFFVYWLASSPFLLLAASFLQFFTVPAFTIGSRMIISAITPPAVFSSGQLISISVYIGAASFLSPLAGGFLSQVLSLDTAIFIFGLLPFVAFLIYSSCQRTLSAI
ncbi:MFS transporter [Enterococcus casseliflavus]|uniref:MFS transporter n=1 Tax=Enterococcus casseliflavus TaxID=37734 RepID=UPI0039A7779A